MLLAQIFAVAIFCIMFFLVITEVIERHYTTLACGLLTLILVFGVGLHSWDAIVETLNFHSIFTLDFWWAKEAHESTSGVNWATIIFIAGMMIMVEGMARVGFFRWLCMLLAKTVKYKVLPIFVTFMVMSAVLAMFIDSITVILFLAAVTVELSQLLKFNPVAMILAEVFCANLGGSATMCGDPPNIIIGTALGYSFSDFLMNTGAIAAIGLVFTVVYFFLVCKKDYKDAGKDVDLSTLPTPKSAIVDKTGFAISTVIFLLSVVLLVTHSATGLSVAFIGTLAAVLTVVGYSLNDKIVVFDRIRENASSLPRNTVMSRLFDVSLTQTLSRTIITSGTTLITVVSLMIFGGEMIYGFALALFVGIVFGTISSIYVASTWALILGIKRENLVPVKIEKKESDGYETMD